MRNIIDLLEGLFCLGVAVYGILYYTGRLPLTDERETRRLERIKKYGPLMIFSIVLILIGGSSLLWFTLVDW